MQHAGLPELALAVASGALTIRPRPAALVDIEKAWTHQDSPGERTVVVPDILHRLTTTEGISDITTARNVPRPIRIDTARVKDHLLRRCLSIDENVAVVATFSFPGPGRSLLTDAIEADYQIVYDSRCRSAPEYYAGAGAQPKLEWPRNCGTWRSPARGRSNPAFAIDALYAGACMFTVCAHNAPATFDDPLRFPRWSCSPEASKAASVRRW